MVLVDTSVWVDYFNGVETAQAVHLDRLLGTGRILTGDLILAELLQGFVTDAAARRARDLLIGTFCLVNRHELLHSDRDFDPMVSTLGLRLAH